MIEGIIITSVAGNYWVETKEGTFRSKPRGILRKEGIKPATGDKVLISLSGDEGVIEEIKARMNNLIRPFVANIDYALLTFSLKKPSPDFLLLDKLIINCMFHKIKPWLVFNKTDLSDKQSEQEILDLYSLSGFPIYFTSALDQTGLDELFDALPNGTYMLAGQSGVGKSTIINKLLGGELLTGEISQKLGRGRHTTRQNTLIKAKEDLYFVDTPGFQNLYLEEEIEAIDVKIGYPEFYEYEGHCKYVNCLHYKEPECAIKKHVDSIHPLRYENYLILLQDILQRRKY